MIRVAVSGAAGRMGRLVCEAVASAPDLDLVAGFDPGAPGVVVGGLTVTDDPEVVDRADVVVEFTRPDVVMENLARWRRLRTHAVVGTSGFDATRLAELDPLWGQGPPNCLVVPNFSIGAVLMMRLSEIAAPHFAAAEVVEMHHDRKVDAPSGTAIATAERIAGAGEHRPSPRIGELVAGARGGRVAEVPVHAVRLPGLVAHQMVLFGNEGETLTISHDTTDRVSFLAGVLLAVGGVAGLDHPVTVGLEGLLGI